MDIGVIIGEGLGFLRELLPRLFPSEDEKSKKAKRQLGEKISRLDRNLVKILAHYPQFDAGELESLLKEKKLLEKEMLLASAIE